MEAGSDRVLATSRTPSSEILALLTYRPLGLINLHEGEHLALECNGIVTAAETVQEAQGRFPDDELLDIVQTTYSPGVRRLMARAGSQSQFEQAPKICAAMQGSRWKRGKSSEWPRRWAAKSSSGSRRNRNASCKRPTRRPRLRHQALCQLRRRRRSGAPQRVGRTARQASGWLGPHPGSQAGLRVHPSGLPWPMVRGYPEANAAHWRAFHTRARLTMDSVRQLGPQIVKAASNVRSFLFPAESRCEPADSCPCVRGRSGLSSRIAGAHAERSGLGDTRWVPFTVQLVYRDAQGRVTRRRSTRAVSPFRFLRESLDAAPKALRKQAVRTPAESA